MRSAEHSLRAAFLRHHDEDDPGLVGRALERRGYTVTIVTVDDRSAPLDLAGIDLLGILGSKWSVYDEEHVGGWLKTELDTIIDADRLGIPVLGICFGAQALCVAMGGRVERAPEVELGWVELDASETGDIPEGPWFQFHEDRCLPPSRAEILLRNDVCVQAFRVGASLGIQFHPELDAHQLSRWFAAGADEVARANGVAPSELLEATRGLEADAADRVDRLVGAFVGKRR